MKVFRNIYECIYTAGALFFCGVVLWVVIFQIVVEGYRQK